MRGHRITGVSASLGFATGRVTVVARGQGTPPSTGASRADANFLTEAISLAIAELRVLHASLSADAADMIVFQIAMLEDRTLAEPALSAIAAGQSPVKAWSDALDREILDYEASAEDYFRARASDLIDIKERVLRHLNGNAEARLSGDAIVVADDLTPSEFLTTPWCGGGILLEKGSATSHVAMLARARGVPMVVSAAAARTARHGSVALLDGAGYCIVEPSADDYTAFKSAQQAAERDTAAIAISLDRPAMTADGLPIKVLLNISDARELDGLEPGICDGIGLVRTELLFFGRALPDEDAQVAVYARIAKWAAGKSVTIRTLDAGGDKPIAGLTRDAETNPFLGVRGVRLSLRHRDLFKTQLRALARAAAEGQIEIMIPMISLPDELRACHELLEEALGELASEGRPHRRPPLGIMVEVPSVAICPERFDADFFSIGSNDLLQYVFAASRDVSELQDIARVDDAAMLRLISTVATHGRRIGRKVSLCGEAAGDPSLIPALLDAGVTILSVAPARVGPTKNAIRSFRGRA